MRLFKLLQIIPKYLKTNFVKKKQQKKSIKKEGGTNIEEGQGNK